MNKHILVLAATEMEIMPLLRSSTLKKRQVSISGRTIMTLQYSETIFKLIITGPGVMNAVHSLTSILEHITPEIIIQAGIAGIFHETGLDIGSIAVADTEKYIHSGVENNLAPFPLLPLPFNLLPSNFLASVSLTSDDNEEVLNPPVSAADKADQPSKNLISNGLYHLDTLLAQQAYMTIANAFQSRPRITLPLCFQGDGPYSVSKFIKKYRESGYGMDTSVIMGSFITVSAITATAKTASNLFSAFSPVMESMEGAAAAHVSALYRIPLIEIRAASNFVGIRDKTKWNIPLAVDRVCFALKSLLEKGEKIWEKNQKTR